MVILVNSRKEAGDVGKEGVGEKKEGTGDLGGKGGW